MRQIIPMLDINDPHLAEKLEAVIGAPLSECEFVTPQFTRTDGRTPAVPIPTDEFFDSLKTKSKDELIALGLQQWDEGHWLYPGEWYDRIPNGYIVTDINGDDEQFIHGETDDDIRYGCLAYGFRAVENFEREGDG